jgi:hypothetical protein
LRESYRCKKHELYQALEQKDQKMALMIVYIAKEELEYEVINNAMTKVLDRFRKILG